MLAKARAAAHPHDCLEKLPAQAGTTLLFLQVRARVRVRIRARLRVRVRVRVRVNVRVGRDHAALPAGAPG